MEEIKNYLNSFGMQIVENKTTYHDDVPNKFSNELQKCIFICHNRKATLEEAWQGKQIAKLCMDDMSIGCLDQLFLKEIRKEKNIGGSKLINHSRSLMQGENEETGLKGENLISELEKNRTGLDPMMPIYITLELDMIFNQLFQKTIEKRYLLKLKPLLESLKIWLHIFIEIK